MSNTKRIGEYFRKEGISLRSVEKTIEASNGTISRAVKNDSDIGSKWVSKIIDSYKIDPIWLLTGKYAEEYKPSPAVEDLSTIFKNKTDQTVSNQMIPLYESFAQAGVTPIFDDFQTLEPIDHLYIPKAPHCDGALYASGDSMYPLIKSGDIVAFKIIRDFFADVYWGNIYILYLEVAGDLFRVIKYVQKGQSPQFLKLVSHNKNHEDQEVSISKVKAMAQVKITVRIN